MNSKPTLVNVADYGLDGINFYWSRKDRYGVTEKELNDAGVFDGNAYVDERIIKPLQAAQEKFKELGYGLIIKDAYRSPELYKLVQQKRYELRGKKETDMLLNLETMPHSTGRVIDVNLTDLRTGEEVKMRNPEHDPDAFFIGYYQGKPDPQSQEFAGLQELLVSTMLSVGFTLGSKKEFWHFEYLK